MADHGSRAQSFDEVVARYLADYSSDEDREMAWFRRQPTVAEAVRFAGLAQRPFGKRFNHQRRIPGSVIEAFSAALLAQLPRIEGARGFADLHNIVQEVGSSLNGIGELTIYDTALRIGAKLHLEPERVYLHTGTRAGAAFLGLGGGRKWIAVNELPSAFRRLTGRQAEDCLCIFRESIRALTAV